MISFETHFLGLWTLVTFWEDHLGGKQTVWTFFGPSTQEVRKPISHLKVHIRTMVQYVCVLWLGAKAERMSSVGHQLRSVCFPVKLLAFPEVQANAPAPFGFL